MLKKLFAAGAALIFFSSFAMADGVCETKADIQAKLEAGTPKDDPDFKIKVVDVTEAVTIAGIMKAITDIAGTPPFPVTDVKDIVIFRPADTEKYNTYFAFLDAKGCKLERGGFMAPEDLVKAVLKDMVLGGPGESS